MTVRVTVDLDAFAANLDTIRRTIAPSVHMLVVKDDAYGHGLDAICTRAYREGVRWFGAFDVATGLAVRALVGEEARIFVWMLAGPDDARAAIDARLDIGVGDEGLLEDLAAVAQPPRTSARVHLKVDTGLHRNGIRPERWDAAVARTRELSDSGSLTLEGVWSHIAEASDEEDDDARARFESALASVRHAGLHGGLRHLSASAAGYARSSFRYDMSRIGAFAYGIRSAGGPDEESLGLRPVATLTASVREVRGERVLLPVGAMDGLPTVLGGLISVGTPAGPRRLVAVRASHLEIEGWDAASTGDRVHILGGDAPHSATDLAERIGTIGEEIAVRVFSAVPREYLGAGPRTRSG